MRISLSDARPGMVLSDDVRIKDDTLLQRDQVLDETLIELMQSCGVTTISVIGDAPDHVDQAASDKEPQGAGSETGSARPETVPTGTSGVPSSRDPGVIAPVKGKKRSGSSGDTRERETAALPHQPSASLQHQPPSINVIVSPDAMFASLIVEPVGDSAAELDRSSIMDALTANDVTFGIDTALIDKLVEQWKENRHRYEINTIAAGVIARPAEEGPVRMLPRHLTSRSECDEVKATRYFWEAAAVHPRIDHVLAGSEIAEKQLGHLSVPGKNVHGVPIFTDEVIPNDVILEEGVAFSNDKQKIIATVDGIAYQIDTVIGVIPVDFNGAFEIEVADDNMTAFCIVHPPGPGGTLPGKEELLRLMAEKGVCSGILGNDIDTLLALCGRDACPSEPFVVARGISPVNGTDGKIEYHFNTQTSLSPSIDNEGHADYKSINIVNTVKSQQELVSLIPPVAGSDGVDVLGRTLPAEPGVAAKLPQGPHTVIDQQNPVLLRAEVDGVVRLTGGLVEISEGFVIPGNIDFSTGNITYNKTVIVNGDVKGGFEVHCGGDLQVNGTIEDCSVTVGGNVLCRYGFVGQGKGVIDAKGDVNLGFMKNQTVRCFRNIIIAKEAINCTILSRNTVAVHGNPLSVAGGEIKARASITVYTAGNHTGIRTLLEAGVDFLMIEELAVVEEQYKSTSAHYHTLAEDFTRFRKMIAGRKRLSSFEQKKINDLGAALKQAKQQLSVLEERKSIIAGKIHSFDEAFIRIEHAAFPGTLFKFGERHYLLKEELAGPKNIRYIEHEIRVL